MSGSSKVSGRGSQSGHSDDRDGARAGIGGLFNSGMTFLRDSISTAVAPPGSEGKLPSLPPGHPDSIASGRAGISARDGGRKYSGSASTRANVTRAGSARRASAGGQQLATPRSTAPTATAAAGASSTPSAGSRPGRPPVSAPRITSQLGAPSNSRPPSTPASAASTPGGKRVVDVRALSQPELADLALKLNYKLKKHQEAARSARRELRRSEAYRYLADEALLSVVGVPLASLVVGPGATGRSEDPAAVSKMKIDERALAARLRQAGRSAESQLRSTRANFEAQVRSLQGEAEAQRGKADRLRQEAEQAQRERSAAEAQLQQLRKELSDLKQTSIPKTERRPAAVAALPPSLPPALGPDDEDGGDVTAGRGKPDGSLGCQLSVSLAAFHPGLQEGGNERASDDLDRGHASSEHASSGVEEDEEDDAGDSKDGTARRRAAAAGGAARTANVDDSRLHVDSERPAAAATAAAATTVGAAAAQRHALRADLERARHDLTESRGQAEAAAQAREQEAQRRHEAHAQMERANAEADRLREQVAGLNDELRAAYRQEKRLLATMNRLRAELRSSRRAGERGVGAGAGAGAAGSGTDSEVPRAEAGSGTATASDSESASGRTGGRRNRRHRGGAPGSASNGQAEDDNDDDERRHSQSPDGVSLGMDPATAIAHAAQAQAAREGEIARVRAQLRRESQRASEAELAVHRLREEARVLKDGYRDMEGERDRIRAREKAGGVGGSGGAGPSEYLKNALVSFLALESKEAAGDGGRAARQSSMLAALGNSSKGTGRAGGAGGAGSGSVQEAVIGRRVAAALGCGSERAAMLPVIAKLLALDEADAAQICGTAEAGARKRQSGVGGPTAIALKKPVRGHRAGVGAGAGYAGSSGAGQGSHAASSSVAAGSSQRRGDGQMSGGLASPARGPVDAGSTLLSLGLVGANARSLWSEAERARSREQGGGRGRKGRRGVRRPGRAVPIVPASMGLGVVTEAGSKGVVGGGSEDLAGGVNGAGGQEARGVVGVRANRLEDEAL